jgi:hypothetical protein
VVRDRLRQETRLEGAPVQNGYISFIPVDGTGGTSGGPIKGGRYKVEDVPPGKKRVEIRAGAELAAMPDLDAPKPKVDPKGQQKAQPQNRPDEELIPPDATGNNEVVDIGRGNQKLPFHLDRPKRKAETPPKK